MCIYVYSSAVCFHKLLRDSTIFIFVTYTLAWRQPANGDAWRAWFALQYAFGGVLCQTSPCKSKSRLTVRTVLNTMCGYGAQEEEPQAAAADIHTAGCLSSILTWARTNVLLVGGLTAGLLLLEVCMISLAAAQVSTIKKVRLQKKLSEESRGASRSRERKDSYWYPAHFDDE